MILIAWFVVALGLFAIGAFMWQPWWVMQFFHERFYCARCHQYIKTHEKFLLEQDARESLESRQV